MLAPLIALFFVLLVGPLMAQSAQEAPFESGQTAVGQKSLPWALLRPANLDPEARYPLVVFLHGRGESGAGDGRQLTYLPKWMASPEGRERFPCFVLAPQCPHDEQWTAYSSGGFQAPALSTAPTWPLEGTIRTLQKTMREEPIDLDRVYLTGLSMGGFGSWELASRYPEIFAALVPVCGGGRPEAMPRLAGMPIWTWHGTADPVVPVERTRELTRALEAQGAQVRSTELLNCGHDAWSAAYGQGGALPWLFAQHRRGPRFVAGLAALRRTQALEEVDRVLFLGDSITAGGVKDEGWITLIDRALEARGKARVEVIGAGISGNRVPDLQERLDRDVIAKRPDVAFVFIGVNDVWHSRHGRGTPAEDYVAGLRDVVARLKAIDCVTILATPMCIGERLQGQNELDADLDRFAQLSREVAAELKVPLCDLRQHTVDYHAFANRAAAKTGLLTNDGVHLNGLGTRFLAHHAAAAIVGALEARAER